MQAQTELGKKETQMFYVANVITFSLSLDLLRKFTLLVRYKLNIFRPPQVNQFDNSALLFGGYTSFIPLDKMVVYGYWKTLPSGSSSMLHIALTFFCCIMESDCSISDYYLNNSNIASPLRVFLLSP